MHNNQLTKIYYFFGDQFNLHVFHWNAHKNLQRKQNYNTQNKQNKYLIFQIGNGYVWYFFSFIRKLLGPFFRIILNVTWTDLSKTFDATSMQIVFN